MKEVMARKEQKNGKTGDFAERLRQLRVLKKLSQEDLGRVTGLHYNHIGRYERGDSRPSADKLKALADALGVTGDYLLNGSGEQFTKVRFEDQELSRMFQEIEQLPDDKKKTVKEFLDAFIFREKVKQQVAS